MTTHGIERLRRGRIGVRRVATPTTAVVIGGLASLLMIGILPLAGLVHQLSFSGYLLELVVWLAFMAVGVTVAYKRPFNRMGWMLLGVSVFGLLNDVGTFYSVLDYRIHHGRFPLGWLAVLLGPSWAPMIFLIALTIFLYPDGRPQSPRWKWPVRWFYAVAAVWQLGAFAIAVSAVIAGPIRIGSGGDLVTIDRPTGGWTWWRFEQDLWFLTIGVIFAGWLISQLLGYRRLAGERRLQQKWIISGAAICVVCGMASVTLDSSHNGLEKFIGGIATVGLAALPVAMGIGILKYRLYEIDRLVSRTLSYAALTGLLVGTFVGLVALTTDVLPFSSPVGVAASTLAAAALFNPLRGRVQRVVDRRFNRARYDAEATVAAFASRLRDAVDVDAVKRELLDVVQRAVEPSHASIWIRSDGTAAAAGSVTLSERPAGYRAPLSWRQ